MESKSNQSGLSLVRAGAEFVGETIASSAEQLLVLAIGGGPLGLMGAGVGAVLRQVFDDVASRSMSQIESRRTSVAAYSAVNRIWQRHIVEGESIREDGFLDNANINVEWNRSPAEELLEGALMKCKAEHEDRKIWHLGQIPANALFMPQVSASAVNFFLTMGTELTYQELCILSLAEQRSRVGRQRLILKPIERSDDLDMISFHRQFDELTGAVYTLLEPSETSEGFECGELTHMGKALYELMQLEDVPLEHLERTAVFFQSRGSFATRPK